MSKVPDLTRLKNYANNIKILAEMIIEDLDEVTEMDDLFTIESKFEQIYRDADTSIDVTRNKYDEFVEED